MRGDLIWSPPRWDGEPAVVIGTGPSLRQSQVDFCKDHARIIAVNDAYRLAPWADLFYAQDLKWWDWHHAEVCKLPGVKLTTSRHAAASYQLQHVRGETREGFCLDRHVIHYGTNSGYQAVNVALLTRAKPIILIGFDHKSSDTGAHFFGEHPDGCKSDYSAWMASWEIAAHGIDRSIVINATTETALKVFRRSLLWELL